ncbi:isoflavone reductase family protein [Fusarium langsethiae]|uniref:Isoflavone reductase family protein n=1 Tax=Fusarium langsethiae TaxID=179993 RepID=A0A0N0DGA9_FUSLA|nr:isoflavone reductase family protein [Fusarium langsethiae]GKU01143.1 unnamed protein product [Fusarium langsethiae]GKU18753.1 unnamed protein product [Fusarium langsethiae]
MMRVAIAGGTGLGYLLASQLSGAAYAYQVVVLSRSEHPEYAGLDVQVTVVDYDNEDDLSFALQGVNLVICTFSGNEQLNLINAAAQNGVQFFVPSEFEGSIDKRPDNDQLYPYSYSTEARQLLRRWARSSQMKWTVFSCGIFMERFLPGGLGSMFIGYRSDLAMAGSYLLDTSSYTAECVEKNDRGHTVRVCMTSVYDVAQFVVAAIVLGPASWPRELTMRGDRLSVRDVVGQCSRALNGNPSKLLMMYPKLTRQPLFSFPSGRPQTLIDLLFRSTNRAIMQNMYSIGSFKQLSKEDMTLARRL